MKMTVLAVLMATAFSVQATNKPNPPQTSGDNEFSSHANSGSSSNSSAGAVGVGLGVGVGGDSSAKAYGGEGGDAKAYGGNSSVKDSGNSYNANSNKQGQSQGQSLNSANLLKMTSENTANLKNNVNASSANDNRSSANGNTTVTNVGGDSTLVERNAPPVFLGNLSATMSCSGGFNAGASDRNGSGAFGLTWISADCRSVVIGKEFLSIGMPDVSCRIWKTTKGYKRAVKADPSLADVDCTIKPTPATVPVLVAPELAPRIPRG